MRPVRQCAHAATIFALFWTIPSLGAIAGTVDNWQHHHWDFIGLGITVFVLVIYAAILILTYHLWKTEKPKHAQNVEGFIIDDLLDTKPDEINLTRERRRLKRIIFSDAGILLFPLIAAWINKIYHLLAIGIFCGSILLLHIVFEVIRYLILKNRFNKTIK